MTGLTILEKSTMHRHIPTKFRKLRFVGDKLSLSMIKRSNFN